MKKSILKSIISTIVTIFATLIFATTTFADNVEDAILTALQNLDAMIDVTEYHITPQQAMNTYFAVISENPDLFYVENTVDCTYDLETGECIQLICAYNSSNAEIDLDSVTYNENVDEIVAQAQQYSTQYDQIKFVHDYFVINFDYDNSSQNKTAYDLFTNKKGVCTAYCGAFSAVMEKLNIPCVLAKSDAMNHEWNMVQLDGIWYHIDVTWDDPIGGNGVVYANFLKSDEIVVKTGHFSWVTDDNIIADDTTYDFAL